MKRIIAICSIAVCAVSCSLKEQLTSYTLSDDFYNTPAECESGLNACYNLIRSQLGGNRFWFAMECTTDLMFLNMSTMYDAILNISPSRPGIATTIWQYSYTGVMRTNAMLDAIGRAVEKGTMT